MADIIERNAKALDGSAAWPVELRYESAQRLLHITFDDGAHFHIAAETLRVESPSAEVQGHGPGQKVAVTGKEHVAITAIEPVGNYAVRITFDDGHNTGLYTWPYLYERGVKRTGTTR